jgi:glutaredoxin
MEISVYGTPMCPKCKDVLNFLLEKDVDYIYNIIGVDVQPEQVNTVVGRPVRAVPVIMVDGVEMSFDNLRERLSSTDILSGLEL